MLWLALHFPLLPLEVLPQRQSPSAVTAGGRIVLADLAAQAGGVRPGQPRATAIGLLPTLRLHERDPARERQALDELACWAGRFTPSVSQRAPASLLLEIGGCLRLFGGLAALVEAVMAEARSAQWTIDWAVAPTPGAAGWLARGAPGTGVTTMAELPAALAGLPCQRLDWPLDVVARLASFGVHDLGGLARLPGSSLRQRLGSAVVDAWLRACGELPDPQKPFRFPERFSMGLELPSRVEFAEGLAFAGQRLLAALAGWLQARQSLLLACTLYLTHDDGSHSMLPLRFGEACADEARFMRLLREHLGRRQRIAPVEALRLDADQVLPRPGASAGLFARASAGEGAAACIERLRARLGDDAVYGLGVQADHRPECATRRLDPASIFAGKAGSTAIAAPARPLWLLPRPQALAEHPDGPHWHGPLQLLTRGERLESGWWDGGESGVGGRRDAGSAIGDIRRDYFVARNPLGQWAWVFRDAQGWYLHGLFA